MKNKIILYLSAFLFFASCKNNTPANYQEFLNKQLQEHYTDITNKYNKIVIIPRSGCHTCKDYADLFFKENKNKEGFCYIFTKITSIKQLKIELGEEALKQSNVKIDNENLFYTIEYIDSAYPLLLTKTKNGIFEYSLLE